MMTCRGLLPVVCFASFVPFLSSRSICVDSDTGQSQCCHDFRNVSGTCEACIGSWGENCEHNCYFGFFGHGCRQKCNCDQNQTCDPRNGCVQISYSVTDPKPSEGDEPLSLISVAIGGMLILSFVGTVWVLLWKLKQNKKTEEIRDCATSGNECTSQNREQECVYSDVRESQMMDNSDISLPVRCTSLRNDPKRNKEMKRCSSLPRRQYTQWSNQITRSRSLVPEHYGGYSRYSDGYNHLQFNEKSTSPDNPPASISDYGIVKPK